MKRGLASAVAFAGVTAALAVVVMSLGGWIPVATYACPMVCCLMLAGVFRLCGGRIAWAWYGAVALLSAMLGPDKEAVGAFVALGYYPILKPWLDRRKFPLLWKLLLFQGAVGLMYGCLIWVFGMEALLAEARELGWLMLGVLLVLGNLTFFLLDRLLTRWERKYGK